MEWYTRHKGNVVVSFSGGKDSTVLLHLVRSLFPDVRAVFSNTGLEYPEIQRFVRSVPNVTIVAPKVSFHEVLSTCGYPLIGKEVAEAIYYARRIRSQNLNVERERENKSGVTPWKRDELCGSRKMSGGGTSGTSDGNSSEPGHFIETSGAGNRRTILMGQYPAGGCIWKPTGDGKTVSDCGRQTTFKRTELGGAEQKPVDGRLSQGDLYAMGHSRTETANRGKWHDYHRRSLNNRKDNPDDLECFYKRRTEWSDWRRGCL